MIDQIISALKISLSECKKYEDPSEYVYQLNSVLNRYKTNLFKMIEDKHTYLHDPREFFQFRIKTSWRTRPGFNRITTIVDNAPILLHVSGFQPLVGERRNKESTYNKAVRIDDIIDLERISLLKTDHYYCGVMASTDYVSESDVLLQNLGLDKFSELSMYLNLDKTADDIIVFSLQLNSIVNELVVDEQNAKAAEIMAYEPGVLSLRQRRKLREEAQAKLLQDKVEEETSQPSELSKNKVKPAAVVDAMFGVKIVTPADRTISASEVKKVQPFRAKNNLGATKRSGNAGLTRKKHNYW